jgi:putative ABC transport system substrate-binding protein
MTAPRLVLMVILMLGVIAAPSAAELQQAGKIPRVGWLSPGSGPPRAALRGALRELGYVEGQTIAFESRGAADNLDRLPELAAELMRAKVDVIVAVSIPAIRAARQATSTIPIVMAYGGAGLVESGIVASFARPGGNATGVYLLASELDGKRLELLLEAVPNPRTVAVLSPVLGYPLPEVQRTAQAAGVHLRVVPVPEGVGSYARVFDSMAKAGVGALLVPASPRFSRDSRRIVEQAAKGRIPAIYEWGYMAEQGGLMAYGPIQAELERRVAFYVDRILKGAKPGELPIEQPTKFELVINLKTAKALGLTIPQTILLRADHVIQ